MLLITNETRVTITVKNGFLDKDGVLHAKTLIDNAEMTVGELLPTMRTGGFVRFTTPGPETESMMASDAIDQKGANFLKINTVDGEPAQPEHLSLIGDKFAIRFQNNPYLNMHRYIAAEAALGDADFGELQVASIGTWDKGDDDWLAKVLFRNGSCASHEMLYRVSFYESSAAFVREPSFVLPENDYVATPGLE